MGIDPDPLPSAPGLRRVLVVEEDPTSRKVALGILRKLGCLADAVASGPEAAKRLERTPYALVLLAVRLPEPDGLKAVAAIRAGEAAGGARLPIIAVASRARGGDRERCLAAGLDDYILKPLDPRVMAGKLAAWLAPGPAAGRPAVPAFDLSSLRDRMMGDAEMADKVLEVFAGDLPLQLAELKRNLKKGDAGAVSKGGHKLKGTAANIGAEALRRLGVEIEIKSAAGDLAAAAALLPRLAAAAAQVLEQIRARTADAGDLHGGDGGHD
ncbi:MAG: response regulator [Elusimicrobia bacterium]|nr:response regulator [Elusimicrobiota bacterium]